MEDPLTDLTGRSLEMTENWIWILAIAMALVTGYLFGRTSSLAEENGGEEPALDFAAGNRYNLVCGISRQT